MKKNRRGKKRTPDLSKNCLHCKLFSNCNDPKKGYNYLCSLFENMANSAIIDLETGEVSENLDKKKKRKLKEKREKKKEKKIQTEVYSDSYDIHKIIDHVISSENPVPPNVVIDDSKIPQAKNFFEFCVDKSFLAQSPFVMQLAVGIKLFSEYCPRCSKKNWFKKTRVGDSYEKLLNRVELLEHGVCKKCGGRKTEFIRNGELNPYTELAGMSGQRCVTSDTMILSEDGLVEIGEYTKDIPKGFSPFINGVNTGDKGINYTQQIYRSHQKENCYKVKLSNGIYIKGTKDHPIMTDNGFKKLSNIEMGDNVRVYYGQQTFGKTIQDLSQITDKTIQDFENCKTNSTNSQLFKSSRKKPGYGRDTKKFLDEDISRLLGYMVSEGSGGRLSNHDNSILEDCYNTLTHLFSEDIINIGKNEIGFRTTFSKLWLSNLIGYDLDYTSSFDNGIPRCIRVAPKNIQIEFLRALFEGDGGVFNSSHKRVEYTSLSYQLIKQLQYILLNIGIPCRVRKRKSWATNGSENQKSKPFYSLSIEGRAINTFREEIGFLSRRKNKTLRRVCRSINNGSNDMPFYYDKLPESYKTELLNVISEAREQIKQLVRKEENSRYVKSIGITSVYENWLYDKLKRLNENNVALTKKKIILFMEPLLKEKWGLSENIKARAKALLEVAREGNYYYEKVVNIKETKKYETYDFTIPEYHRFWTNGIMSHNSGKSAFVGGMLAPYVLHGFLKMQDPTRAFGLLPGTILHGIFVALSFKQAQETAWGFFVGTLREAPWFSEYHDLLKKYGEKNNEEYYKIMDTYVMYKHSGPLLLYPSGPDQRKLRGRTTFMNAIDEIGWLFDSSTSKSSLRFDANEIYKAVKNSLRTATIGHKNLVENGYDKIIPPILANISSPSSKFDKINSLYEKSKRSRHIFGFHTATWEFNPEITFKELEDEFNEDEVRAWRDYGAVPPFSSFSLFNDIDVFSNIVDKNKNNFGLLKKINVFTKTNKEVLSGKIKNIEQGDKIPRVMAIDAGQKNNSFAITVGHNKICFDNEGDRFLVPCYDFMGEVTPNGRLSISFTHICNDVIVPLARVMNVELIVADRWQSTKLIGDVEEKLHIEKEIFSLKYKHFVNFREDVISGNVLIPRPELGPKSLLEAGEDRYPQSFENKPVAHFIFQCLTVQDKDGKAVIKGDNATDDIFRSTVLAHSYLVHEKYKELFQGSIDESKKGFGAAYKSLSDIKSPVSNTGYNKNTGNTQNKGASASFGSHVQKIGSGHVFVLKN